MRDLNIVPDHITLTTIMSAAPTAEAAIRLMASLLEDYPYTVKRHTGCFNALLSRLRDERDYVNMQHWWQEMRKRNITPYCTMSEGVFLAATLRDISSQGLSAVP